MRRINSVILTHRGPLSPLSPTGCYERHVSGTATDIKHAHARDESSLAEEPSRDRFHNARLLIQASEFLIGMAKHIGLVCIAVNAGIIHLLSPWETFCLHLRRVPGAAPSSRKAVHLLRRRFTPPARATRHLHFRVVAHQKCDYACHNRTGR
jgi:hypothetical protein